MKLPKVSARGTTRAQQEDAVMRDIVSAMGCSAATARKYALQGRMSGLSFEEILALAHEGLYGTTAYEWGVIRSLFAVTSGDVMLTKHAHAADLTADDLKAMMEDPQFSPEALQVVSQIERRQEPSVRRGRHRKPSVGAPLTAAELRRRAKF